MACFNVNLMKYVKNNHIYKMASVHVSAFSDYRANRSFCVADADVILVLVGFQTEPIERC